ncbi:MULTISPECIES: hypothetical protein [unclassified Bradyrhizobium]|uniref:hypothetical protein n=1 Tax=unclassified Bradyrhizobium TaxID=2631580 RepID=UPI003393975F
MSAIDDICKKSSFADRGSPVIHVFSIEPIGIDDIQPGARTSLGSGDYGTAVVIGHERLQCLHLSGGDA